MNNNILIQKDIKIKESIDPKSYEEGYNQRTKEILEKLDKMPKLLWRDDIIKEFE